MIMDRDSLAGLLDGHGEAAQLAKDAFLAGADYRLWDDGTAHVGSLWAICGWRLRLVQRKGRTSTGFVEAVEALRVYGGTPDVVIGHIDDRPQSGYYFQLFLAADLSEIIACLGVVD
ncbi:hypothetical protein [Amycolatopsis balhimycina]|uniref:hypothetical protein n=1 Tax=Amycolatopsis balhimycina TaxID=208443 RepID=UPI000F77B9EE|nr:hypothetical protein [Amycolatopsis balhimycina]